MGGGLLHSTCAKSWSKQPPFTMSILWLFMCSKLEFGCSTYHARSSKYALCPINDDFHATNQIVTAGPGMCRTCGQMNLAVRQFASISPILSSCGQIMVQETGG